MGIVYRDTTFLTACAYPNPSCQRSVWEETGAPGENQ